MDQTKVVELRAISIGVDSSAQYIRSQAGDLLRTHSFELGLEECVASIRFKNMPMPMAKTVMEAFRDGGAVVITSVVAPCYLTQHPIAVALEQAMEQLGEMDIVQIDVERGRIVMVEFSEIDGKVCRFQFPTTIDMLPEAIRAVTQRLVAGDSVGVKPAPAVAASVQAQPQSPDDVLTALIDLHDLVINKCNVSDEDYGIVCRASAVIASASEGTAK